MRGETSADCRNMRLNEISIHSPHARGDDKEESECHVGCIHFNPLPSCEGRHEKTAKSVALT